MIYRVHRQHKENGSLGFSLGYINLCYGFITVRHICDALFEHKFIPEKWFSVHELQLVPAKSKTGVNSYLITRRPPHRTHLFYLSPVEPVVEKDYQQNWIAHYLDNSIINQQGQIIVNTVIPPTVFTAPAVAQQNQQEVIVAEMDELVFRRV